MKDTRKLRVMKTIPIPVCPICQSSGGIKYRDLEDKLYFSPGRWSLKLCNSCESYWLDPRPMAESFDLIYPQKYATHTEPTDRLASGGPFAKLLHPAYLSFLSNAFGYTESSVSHGPDIMGKLIASIGYLRAIKGDLVRFLPAIPGGNLLDIGCGNGSFLLTMEKLGWQVRGIEPDPTAAAIARRHGLDVEESLLDDSKYLEANQYDAITMSHVIEHLPDPILAVKRVSQALKTGGMFVSFSPNPKSAMIMLLKKAWVGWDPPRHFVLPGSKALRYIAASAGLDPAIWTRTPTQVARRVAQYSLGVFRHQDAAAYRGRWWPRMIEASVRAVEIIDNSRGDEIVLVGYKR